jgi:hypothetical protein
VTFHTQFGSLADFRPGGVEVIDDDARHYVFSNVFAVAQRAQPWERIAVAKNFEYVIEAVRASGESPWWTARHDEFVLCMDGQVEVELHKPTEAPRIAADRDGGHRLAELPAGRRMGRIVLGRGHMALLPKLSAYRLRASAPGVVLVQTIEGPETIARWADICQTTPMPRTQEATP